MRRDTLREKLFTRRAAIVAGGQGLLLAAIGGRMYQLQILDSERYTVLADENRMSLRLIAPVRGRILDRFGIALAENQHNYHLVVVPEQAGDVAATLDALGALIEVSETDRRRVLREIRRKHSFVPIVVRANLGWDEMARIEVAIPELPGLSIDQGVTRRYPFGETTAHIVGYVAAVSEQELDGDPLLEMPDFRIGKSAVEKSQDLELRGTAGTSQVEVNALGRVVRDLARVAGKPGQDAVTSLDMAMQEFVTRRCSSEQSVACVLLDAHRRYPGARLEPELRSAAVLDRAHLGDVAGARKRPAQAAVEQGDRRRLPAGLDVQAGGGVSRADRRSSDAPDLVYLPRISPIRQCDVSLLEAWRSRHPAPARCHQEIL